MIKVNFVGEEWNDRIKKDFRKELIESRRKDIEVATGVIIEMGRKIEEAQKEIVRNVEFINECNREIERAMNDE